MYFRYKNSDDKLNGELLKLGFEHKDNKYIVPSHRADICNINDIAEEVARIIGYNNIPVNNFEIPKLMINLMILVINI